VKFRKPVGPWLHVIALDTK